MHMAQTTGGWTLPELHRLPDDGNKYELVRGELFVTPPPSVAHEELASVLGRILDRYVDAWGLGRVYRPRAVIQVMESQVEPDLMVRPILKMVSDSWARAPLPILVVEILSGSTRRRDHVQKRELYLDVGVPEYWIVDGDERTIRVVRPGRDDFVNREIVVFRDHVRRAFRTTLVLSLHTNSYAATTIRLTGSRIMPPAPCSARHPSRGRHAACWARLRASPTVNRRRAGG